MEITKSWEAEKKKKKKTQKINCHGNIKSTEFEGNRRQCQAQSSSVARRLFRRVLSRAETEMRAILIPSQHYHCSIARISAVFFDFVDLSSGERIYPVRWTKT
jgi:hypothetical protein